MRTSAIKPSHNKLRTGLSAHCQNNVAFTRFHVHGQRGVSIRRKGLSHLHDCLNSRTRTWISCTSVYLGLHQFSPHMDCSLAWLYSSISQNLHGGGMMRISCARERPTLNRCALSHWLPPATNYIDSTLLACLVCAFLWNKRGYVPCPRFELSLPPSTDYTVTNSLCVPLWKCSEITALFSVKIFANHHTTHAS